ncbi:MAG: alkaline shock response membrane anchor protein AmaP [Candidatus Omnitrophica bacterium]|nr:alkaline shock response membrane anchor protein AmaP [Candidatus Omnitrophota bacterium]
MKVGNAVAQLFAIFSFLTLGSLLIIVSVHLLAFEDAILKVQEIYQDPWRSAQVGIVGLVFIVLGLAFSKMLVKAGRPNEAVIFQSEAGPMVVSSRTLESTALKAAKQLSLIKKATAKINIAGRDVEIKMRLVLWSGASVPSLLSELQQEVQAKVKRLLGEENRLTVTCDVRGIDEAGAGLSDGGETPS